MKYLFALFAFVGFQNVAECATWVCISGSAHPDGSIATVTMNEQQVTVLKDGSITAYALNDQWSLFNGKYNLNQPFNMALVTAIGTAGSYVESGSQISASWRRDDTGTVSSNVVFAMDLAKKTGEIQVNKVFDANGDWAGTEQDSVVCSDAGIL